MRYLSLDISGSVGWALFEDSKMLECGSLDKIKTPFTKQHPGGINHPWDLIISVTNVAQSINDLINEKQPNVLIIEQTNKGRNRFGQKFLEWVHFKVVTSVMSFSCVQTISYIDTSEWRKILGIRSDKEIKKYNRDLKKSRGSGKITIKTITIHWANERYGFELLAKDDDIADALAMATAHLIKIGIIK